MKPPNPLRDPVLRALAALFLALLLWALAARAGDEPAYDRREWMPHGWEDADKNCRDTRQEVLARESFPETVKWDASGCRVVSGWWRDPYSGQVVRDPAELDIDHTVPLRWAWARGGAAWPPERKVAFANELGYRGALVPTTVRVNRAKGARGPDLWIPTSRSPWNGAELCEYGIKWSVMTTIYNLRLEDSERAAIRLLVSKC